MSQGDLREQTTENYATSSHLDKGKFTPVTIAEVSLAGKPPPPPGKKGTFTPYTLAKSLVRGAAQIGTGLVDLAVLPQTIVYNKAGIDFNKNFPGTTEWATNKGIIPPEQPGLINQGIELGTSMLSPENLAKNAATAGIFIGTNAKTFDFDALNLAEKMRAAKDSAKKIWDQTGTRFWRSGPRQEISDAAKDGVRIFPEYLKDLRTFQAQTYKDYFKSKLPWQSTEPLTNKVAALGEILDHKELYKAYPGFKKLRVIATSSKLPGHASFIPESGIIKVSYIDMLNQNYSPLLHEIQHAIQSEENWYSLGSNIEYEVARLRKRFPNVNEDRLREVAFEYYKRNPGEVEARLTQARLKKTKAERQKAFPDDDMDRTIAQMLKTNEEFKK